MHLRILSGGQLGGTKQTIKWNTPDLPAIPFLTNKKAIKKHTQVKLFFEKPIEKTPKRASE